jgi:hypothetical protein
MCRLSGQKDSLRWIESLDTMQASEIADEMDQLSAIRYKYPGLCALNFEFLLEIVLDKLVGDNETKKGVFGIMEAYGAAIEEQGRKSLHAHILVYCKGWNETLRKLNSPRSKTRAEAESEVIAFVESVMSTELTPSSMDEEQPAENWTQCLECKQAGKQGHLEFASNQQLRNLRHEKGCEHEEGVIAVCPMCHHRYRGDELAMKRTNSRDEWLLPETALRGILKRDILMSQLRDPETEPDDNVIGKVNYLFNNHLDHHCRTCFKKGSECRANLPDRAEPKTTVLHGEEDHEGFAWTGEPLALHSITVRPKRLSADAYTNTYCKYISNSIAPCNSNISVTTGARSTIYATCYAGKATQKEDTKEYEKAVAYVGHRFLETRRDSAMFEGISRLMGTALVATSEHVVSAPMAAYIVRNQSRFRCSHPFKYVPAKDIADLIEEKGGDLRMSVMGHYKGAFLSNDALHYLHRPESLEDLSLVEFSEDYETVRIYDEENEIKEDMGEYEIDDEDHPGFEKQYVRVRGKKHIPQFSHWLFPDTASFEGCLWTLQYPVNASVERYCQTVLILFHPFRRIEDITVDGSYYKKFIALYGRNHGGALSPRIKNILSNVQMFYNSMRMPPRKDPIFEETTVFKSELDNGNGQCEDAEAEEDEEFVSGMFHLLSATSKESQPSNSEEEDNPVSYSLNNIRGNGARGCGFHDLPAEVRLKNDSVSENKPFILISETPTVSLL